MLNSIRFTQAEEHLLVQMEAKEYVLTMFDLQAEQYHEMQYNAAHNYLIYYTNNDEQLIEKFMRCKSFWDWWKNGYANRDIEFMLWDCTQVHSSTWFNHYLQIHDSRSLAETVYPGAAVWREMKKEGWL